MEVSGKSGFKQLPNLIKRVGDIKTGKTDASPATSADRNRDKVVLSQRVREIYDAKMKLLDIPDLRLSLINDIRHRIDTGTYQVKGDKIAFRMIRESVLNQRI